MGQEEEDEVRNFESSGNIVYNSTLDRNICEKELHSAIQKLKNNKSPGFDNILNEFFKHGNTLMKNVILKLFNAIFNSGCFPKIWAIGEIIPIHKKGDVNDPRNYRGLTLLSCAAKLFTSIINNRLTEWAEDNKVFCEYQYGFRKQRGTTDCMFILHGIINLLLNKSKPLFCSFVDLQKAFDGTNRRALWYKLNKNNISTKIINLIKNMYSKIKLCVKGSIIDKTPQSVDVSLSDSVDKDTDHVDDVNNDVYMNAFVDNACFFTSIAGVFQGESLSPFLFSMFLNDLNDNLKAIDDVGVKLDEWLMTLLLFADDMVIFSETRAGLQKGLDLLEQYCLNWGLVVNVNKTKCVAFRNGGRLVLLDKWTYHGEELETVNQYKYLGFVFGSSGKFSKGIDDLKC